MCKVIHCFVQILSCDHTIFYYFKSLSSKPFHLIFSGIMHIYILCRNQSKCIKAYISFCRDLIIQLSNRTTAEISRIFVLCIYIFDRIIDLFKIRISNDGFPSQDQSAPVRNFQRNVLKYFCIICNYLSHGTISSGNGFKQFSIFICENDRKPIHLPGKQGWMCPDKRS